LGEPKPRRWPGPAGGDEKKLGTKDGRPFFGLLSDSGTDVVWGPPRMGGHVDPPATMTLSFFWA